MNKKMLVSVLAAGALMSMNAFAGDITVEEVLSNYAAANATTTEASCEATVFGDVSLNVPDMGMDLAVLANMNLDMDMDMTVPAVAATGDASITLMGETMAMDLGIYLVPDGDGLVSYTDVAMDMGEEEPDRQVQKMVLSAEDTAQLMDALAQSQNAPLDLTALPINFELADGLVDMNGVDCYEVTATITADELPALIGVALDAASAAAPQAVEALPSAEDLGALASLATGLKVNLTLDVDAESFKPMAFMIDMDGSDWGVIATLAASALGLTNEDGSLMEVNISANDLFVAYTYDYAEVGEITVPQDVIDSAEEVSMEEIEALAGEMVGEVEG